VSFIMKKVAGAIDGGTESEAAQLQRSKADAIDGGTEVEAAAQPFRAGH
jgi:hypothetical protein